MEIIKKKVGKVASLDMIIYTLTYSHKVKMVVMESL